MADFLFYGDTKRSAAMRHELPIEIIDGFLLAIVDGRTHVMVNSLERERVAATAPDAVLHDIEELGLRELMKSGMSYYEIDLELASRAVAEIGVRSAIADPELPVAVADRLRADGITIQPDQRAIADRRRRKSDAELAGIRARRSLPRRGCARRRRCSPTRVPTATACWPRTISSRRNRSGPSSATPAASTAHRRRRT